MKRLLTILIGAILVSIPVVALGSPITPISGGGTQTSTIPGIGSVAGSNGTTFCYTPSSTAGYVLEQSSTAPCGVAWIANTGSSGGSTTVVTSANPTYLSVSQVGTNATITPLSVLSLSQNNASGGITFSSATGTSITGVLSSINNNQFTNGANFLTSAPATTTINGAQCPTFTFSVVATNTPSTVTTSTCSILLNLLAYASGTDISVSATSGVISFVNAQNFITGNQTITLTGPVTGSGATTIATALTSPLAVSAINATTITATTSITDSGTLQVTGALTASSTLTATNGLTSLASTTITGNATATSLTITALGTSGSNCLTAGSGGAVATTTCGSGGSGSVTTSSAPTANQFPYWANATGGLSGTSTLNYSTSTGDIGIGTSTPSWPLTVVGTTTVSNNGTLAGDLGQFNIYVQTPSTNEVLFKVGSSNGNNQFEVKDGSAVTFGNGLTAGNSLNIGEAGTTHEIFDSQANNNQITWWNASSTLSVRSATAGWVSIQPLATLDTAIGYPLTTAPSSTLDVGGSVGLLATTTSTQAVALGNSYLYLLNVTSTATATLPIVATAQNREYEIKDTGTATANIVPGTSTDYIYTNTATTTSYMISPGQSVTMHDDGTYWQTVGEPSILRGTSNALGGTLTGVGTCVEATGTVAGILPTMSVSASPATTTDIGDGLAIRAWASGTNLATVEECSLLATITSVSVPFTISAIP